MKLSLLLDYYNGINSLPVSTVEKSIADYFHLLDIKANQHADVSYKMPEIVDHRQQLLNTTGELAKIIDTHMQGLTKTIKKLQQEQELKDRNWYMHEARLYDNPQAILERTLDVDPADWEKITGTLGQICSWQWPALIVRPCKTLSLFPTYFASVPLYFADNHIDLVNHCRDKVVGWDKILKYTVDDTLPKLLSRFPQTAFGLIFAHDYFHWKSWEVMRNWLSQAVYLLAPGGYFIFTFNDCDYPYGCALSEKRYQGFTPGSWIRQHANDYGYEVVDQYRGQSDFNLMVLKRRGDLNSIKGGVSMARINSIKHN